MEILVKKCLMPLALKTQDDSLAFIHELKKEMHADLKYVESLEDELDELESDNEITELQCLYLHKVMECDCLAQNATEQTYFLTSNANAVCATCGKCVFNSNHDACVSKYLNDVNARTKKPNVVPISTRKPKRQANKSVATPHKKTVASESTTTSSKSYYRMLYQKTSKAWKWWIAQQCPSSYTWVPKTQKKWVPRTQKKWVPPKTQKQWVPKVRKESVPKKS
ncbi:hypothetical protein Tco_0988808 [Tanacetum coccineum]|uniref:Uncharacterized protein n=1 Tax=Tanacetum coccineum TaxID=301880 RepID=A0ABQ5ESC0_9ASTR